MRDTGGGSGSLSRRTRVRHGLRARDPFLSDGDDFTQQRHRERHVENLNDLSRDKLYGSIRSGGEFARTSVMFLGVILGYMIVLLRDFILPERFLADGILIRDIANGLASADFSYTNTARVYALLGLASNSLVAYLVGYTLAVAAIFIVWSKCRRLTGGWTMTVLLIVTLILSAVYLGYYSKDVLVLPIVMLALSAVPARKSGFAIFSSMLVYAYLFRNYWLFVAILFVVFWLLLPKIKAFWLLMVGAVATACSSYAIVVVLGSAADSFRTDINEYRENVGTLIEPFVTMPEPLGGIVNNVLTYFALIVPLPVATIGSAYYLAIAAIFCVFWGAFFRAMSSDYRDDPMIRRCAAILMAFVCTQALFEPDYGSALRHLTPLMPLLLFVVWRSAGLSRQHNGQGSDSQSSRRLGHERARRISAART